ncbi:guanine nucleotide-binding protein G(I)/G(S)/G(O) subunit gamma-T2 isoform X2 [Rhineura floridana]|nr:guanine nucleotide-binding protein G(I)/G(S)/G(O) subunit gamma-T2 isoform X2 [Rhineura floridana]XP_061446122.1 guanine nucleotide-binding protein G(I)/G(S)/G(O) subunit gamma-T2 isoform X2 [Rhineura floridana]
MRLEFSRGDGNEETGDAHPTAHLKTPAPEQRARGQGAVPHWNPPGNSLVKEELALSLKPPPTSPLHQLGAVRSAPRKGRYSWELVGEQAAPLPHDPAQTQQSPTLLLLAVEGKMAQDMTEKELIKMELDQLKKEVKLERQMVSKIAKELKEYIESTAAEDPLLKGGDVWTPLLAFHPRTKELDTGLHRDKEKEDKLSFRTSSPIPVL